MEVRRHHAVTELLATFRQPLCDMSTSTSSPTNRFFVGGNWKLNGTKESIAALVETYNNGGDFPSSVEVVVAPTALHIGYVQAHMRPDVAVCAQNVSTDTGFGALTGELTADLFKAWNVNWTIAGHSERRRRKQIRGLGHDEGSDSVAKKTKCVSLDLCQSTASTLNSLFLFLLSFHVCRFTFDV